MLQIEQLKEWKFVHNTGLYPLSRLLKLIWLNGFLGEIMLCKGVESLLTRIWPGAASALL